MDGKVMSAWPVKADLDDGTGRTAWCQNGNLQRYNPYVRYGPEPALRAPA